MPSIPLPFVIALLLGLILVRMTRHVGWEFGLFSLLVATFAAQAILSGLNWNFGWYPARLIQPIVAAILPALSFAAFDQLRHNRPISFTGMLHLLPAVLIAIFVAFWRAPIDIALFVIYLGYGLGLLSIARKGPGALSAVRIADEWTAHKALAAVAVMLIATAFSDAIVSFDLILGDGQKALSTLIVANVLWLAVAGYAATVADNARPHSAANSSAEDVDPSAPQASASLEDDQTISNQIDTLMLELHLYRDPDLTLERLARRAGIPARQISGALNRIHGRNISQIVNQYRVDDAKRRLTTTADAVTTIMLDSGFGTK
jgi:AraC-like DNA-binding protein